MRKFISRRKKAGMAPGALVHLGEQKIEKAKITIMRYSPSKIDENVANNIDECFPIRDEGFVTWINVDGVHDTEIIRKIGDYLELHPLVQEDIVNTDQRPKMEDFTTYIYTVLRMLSYNERADTIDSEQMSLILGKNYVISFQEREGDIFNPIRDRIRKNKTKTRKMGADYLAYSLLDAIVDSYFVILEKLGEKVEYLEDELVVNPGQETVKSIHILKREMIFLRKSVWPLREVVSGLRRGESQLIKKTTNLYLGDVYDHTIQVIDTIETLRDMLTGMLDIYLSSISNRMNEVMKVLTVMATIFIPITFIASLYGMNFRYMSELDSPLGYPAVLVLMAVIALGLTVYFHRKKWL
jgi:magnesium transporter